MGNEPPIIDQIIDENADFDDWLFDRNLSDFNRNTLSFAIVAGLESQLNKTTKDLFIPFDDQELKHRIREYIESKSIKILTNGAQVFRGLSLRPIRILNSADSGCRLSFLTERIIRVKGIVIGTPKDLQDVSNKDSQTYRKELDSMIKNIESILQRICLGNSIFRFQPFSELMLSSSNNLVDSAIPDEETSFLEEYDAEAEDNDIDYDEVDYEEDFDSTDYGDLLEESLIAIPASPSSEILKEASLVVGQDFKRFSMAIMPMLERYGPFYYPRDLSYILIPIYPNSQFEILEEIKQFCDNFLKGFSVGRFSMSGFQDRFKIPGILHSPVPIDDNLLVDGQEAQFQERIRTIIRSARTHFQTLTFEFHKTGCIPLVIFGQREEQKTRRGLFSTRYAYVKRLLTEMGIPNQVIVKFKSQNKDPF